MLDRKSLLLTVLFVLIISVSAAGMAIYVLTDQGIKDAFLMSRVAGEIRDLFPEEYDHTELILSARNAMLERLDRYSGYIDKSRFERLNEELSGGYDGLGITIVQDSLGLVIVSVRENGPAATAGLMTGDIITQADSTLITGMNSSEATRHLRGKEGTEVSLVIWRPAIKDTLQISVTRERIPLLHIPFAGITPDSMLYVRLLDFESGASDDLESALD
ncbi:MAG: PDZ domain-containing protein, partial [bacterium]|nr:PDZ domain-containing protein [bacterium]